MIVRRIAAALAVLLLSLPLAARASAAAAAPPLFADSGEHAAGWEVFNSEGVDLKLSVGTDPTDGKPALKLEFDFRLGSGYAGIRRKVGAPLPANYQLSFDLRSDLPDNNLETKLVSPDGHDVWWVNRRAMEFPRQWTTLTARRRHFEFAWGPSGGRPMDTVGSVEIVVASAEGGRGTLWLRNIEMRELAAVSPDQPRLIEFFTAPGAAPRTGERENPLILKGWHPPRDGAASLELHLLNPPEIGGLDIEWARDGVPSSLVLEASDDRVRWRPVRTVECRTARQFVRLGEFGHPWLRLTATADGNRSVKADRLAVVPVEHATATGFAMYTARQLPRGMLPRGFLGEQSYWTVIGVPEGRDEALMSEDGAVEVGRGDFTVEPFLELPSGIVGWHESSITHSLARGALPIPTVTRRADGLALEITCAADGPADAGDLLVRYRLINESKDRRQGRLVLAVRPYQVNPPTQWLNLPGGAAPVRSVAWSGPELVVNAKEKTRRRIMFSAGMSQRRAAAGDWGDSLRPDGYILATDGQEITDSTGAASAGAAYEFALDPGQSATWWATSPLTPGTAPSISADRLALDAEKRLASAIEFWRERITPVKLQLPRAHQAVADTAISTVAYILINKDGPGIQPGSRNYERSWIRDGSLTSAALLAFGHADEVRRFIEWYGARQFDSGAVPCVVDRRGPDPVAEHDSHGQFIWLVWNYYRHTGDRALLEGQFPRVLKAAQHIQQLRTQRLTDEWTRSERTLAEPGKPPVPAAAFAGLVPASISHEGYSAKPMHSYWDDAFCLLGLRCATQAAHAVGDSTWAAQIDDWARQMARSMDSSVAMATAAHGIDYFPGCVELGDFDPTSTTVALWPCSIGSDVLTPFIERTFERNWNAFVGRRDASPATWRDYTPYELRQVGAYVQLGRPDRAAEVLDFHMAYRRPAAWNHWAEVVRPDPRTAGFVGDMPHTWCGSDFLNSLRMMFAYERPGDSSIVLLGGIPGSWIATGEPISVADLGMPGGRLSLAVQRHGDRVSIRAAGTLKSPPGGFRVRLPDGTSESGVTLNGEPARAHLGEVRLDIWPSTIDLAWDDPANVGR
ncbi:MAG: hypothetical protein L6Q35_02515 [Phycisphaerales bacterium]|nr:hypothetical protein [Phycisphaerales bacterium]